MTKACAYSCQSCPWDIAGEWWTLRLWDTSPTGQFAYCSVTSPTGHFAYETFRLLDAYWTTWTGRLQIALHFTNKTTRV